jgi:hypothetical protein
MRQLHIVRRADERLALEVAARQLGAGDEVRVVLTGEAVELAPPAGAEAVRMAALEYDQLVDLIAWSDRVVSW